MFKVESEVQTSQNMTTEREWCGTCNFILGVLAATEKLHCVLPYYKAPALDRWPAELETILLSWLAESA